MHFISTVHYYGKLKGTSSSKYYSEFPLLISISKIYCTLFAEDGLSSSNASDEVDDSMEEGGL